MVHSEDYLAGGFQEDLHELERTRVLIKEVGNMFGNLVVENQWPYEVKHRRPVNPDDHSYSQSTNAMILFALIAASHNTARECPLVPVGSEGNKIDLKKETCQKVWDKLVEETEKTVQQHEGARSHVCWSETFGYDDPFTLMWLLEIKRSGIFTAMPEKVSNALQARALDRVERLFASRSGATDPGTKNEDADHGSVSFEHGELGSALLEWAPDPRRRGMTSLDHAFPVLRYVHLYRGLQALPPEGSMTMTTSRVRRYMQGRLHEQLSKSEIQDGEFDAAEMVFALEGLLLLDPNSIGRALLDRVFHVIAEGQVRNPYWRPVKPFVATPQGQVLFPLSVETASSLLRCCALIDKEQNDLASFSQNIELFKRYAAWLRTRLKKGTALTPQKLVDFIGWHSEYVHLHEGIHLWQTSQVLLFLIHYAAMLDQHIARRSLVAANLTMTRPWKDSQGYWHTEYWQEEKRQIGEPLASLDLQSRFLIYRDAGEHFIAPRPYPSLLNNKNKSPEHGKKIQYSMLLYGPPGTGKTSFAEEICKALRWPLITVTPSDFIRGGESEVEARAKMIFEVLYAQSNVVILFDEIDRMILDRDSTLYAEQSDIFQFMTPSMLTKLRELRKKEQVVFLIATNYAERIDAAAKRRGRLDAHGLLPPPDCAGRTRILQRLFNKQLRKAKPGDTTEDEQSRKENARDAVKLEAVAKKMRLKVFGEINAIFDDAIDHLSADDRQDPTRIIEKLQERAEEADSPAISLSSYASRFNNPSVPQKPYDEFLLLLHLCLEDGGKLRPDEKELADQVLKTLLGVKKKSWSSMDADQKKQALQSPLAEQLRNDTQLVQQILDSYRF